MTPDDVVNELSKLQAKRSNWDSTWEEVADFVLPRQSNFNTKRTPGENRNDRIYDSTGPLALERFAAALESMLTPRAQKWHRLQPSDPALLKSANVKMWYEEVNGITWRARYRPYGNYASSQHEVYLSLGAFGTGCMYVDNVMGKGIRYKAIPLAETFIDVDSYGLIDTVYRLFKLDIRQAVQAFGEDNLPKEMLEAGQKDNKREFEFIHCVKPNADYDGSKADARGQQFSSTYVAKDYRAVVGEGGYNTMPYITSRYVVSPDEDYGRSPAIAMLSDLKMINKISRDQIQISHKLADPPLLLHDDGILGYSNSEVNMMAGGLNYGGVSQEGRQLIQPLQTGGNPAMSESLLDQRRRSVNDAFLVSLFQILVETPEMTATEAMIRVQEKGQLLGPTISRQQSEALGPMIEREVDILARMGALPEPPPELIEAGMDYGIEYDSPMTRMMQAEEVVGLQRSIEAMTPFIQTNPALLNIYNAEQVMRDTNYINGVPTKWLKTEEEVAEQQAQEQEDEEAAKMLEAAPMAAGAMKDTAQAQALMAKARTI